MAANISPCITHIRANRGQPQAESDGVASILGSGPRADAIGAITPAPVQPLMNEHPTVAAAESTSRLNSQKGMRRPTSPPMTAKPINALIVEDDPSSAEALAETLAYNLRREGFDACFPKPFEGEQIVAAIHNLVDGRA